ncbi:MAG TPA: radical SAM protein [archaeon]|nr:radical SAM protein [archaeon]
MHVPKLFLTEPYSWKIKDIDLRPTYRCQAKCPTCGAWKRDTTALNLDQTKQIVKHFRDLRQVTIEGGEPTYWEHLIYFIKHLDAEDIPVITNAINTERIKEISEYFTPDDFRWIVSIGGLNETHDFMRGTKGAFDALVKSVDIIKSHNYNIRFQFFPSKSNIQELDKTKEFIFERWGIDPSLVLINYPSYAGIYGENVKCEYLNESEMRELLINEPQGKWLSKLIKDIYTAKAIKKKYIPCMYGRSKIFIRPDGGIGTCQYMDNNLFGRVLNTTVTINREARRDYCFNKIPSKCRYSTGQLCSHEAATRSIRHNFLYLARNAWRLLT